MYLKDHFVLFQKFIYVQPVMKKPYKGKVLILGLGNILLQDEGIGIHTIKFLEKLKWPEGVDLLDGGTGGFHILSILDEYPAFIMIDAALDDYPPGTIRVLKPRFATDFPKALSSHDIGLKDLIESANLLGPLPKIYLIAVSIQPEQELNMELSGNFPNVLPEIATEVKKILTKEF